MASEVATIGSEGPGALAVPELGLVAFAEPAGDQAAAALAEIAGHAEVIADARSSPLALATTLEEVLHRVDADIAAEARLGRQERGGIAVILAVPLGEDLVIAFAGDPQGFVVRGGTLSPLVAPKTRHGSVVRRAPLGSGYHVDVETSLVPLVASDVVLLCARGFAERVDERAIAALVAPTPLDGIARRMAYAGGSSTVEGVLLRPGAQADAATIERVAAILSRALLFADLTDAERRVVAPYLDMVHFAPGDFLLREGENGDRFYVVLEGAVRVTRTDVAIRELGPGDSLGELGLAGLPVRTASAQAIGPAWACSLSRRSFDELLRRRPELGARLAMSLLKATGDRLRDVTDRLAAVG